MVVIPPSNKEIAVRPSQRSVPRVYAQSCPLPTQAAFSQTHKLIGLYHVNRHTSYNKNGFKPGPPTALVYTWHLRTVAPLPFFFFFFLHTFTFQLLDKPWSQVSSLLPPGSCLQFLSRIGFSNPTARRLFIRVLLTHALALSASQFVHKKKSQRIYTSMHSAGLELTTLTYTRLEDNLIRHRGDRDGSS